MKKETTIKQYRQELIQDYKFYRKQNIIFKVLLFGFYLTKIYSLKTDIMLCDLVLGEPTNFNEL